PTYLFSEHRHTNYNRMEGIAQREIDHDAKQHNKRLICPADGLGGRVKIAAALRGNARVNPPSQERARQSKPAAGPHGEPKREGPGLYACEHRMFKASLDVAGNKSGDDEDRRE